MTLPKFIIAHLDDDPLELKHFTRHLKNDTHFEIHSFTHSDEFLKFIKKAPQLDFCVLDIILSAEEKIDGLSLIKIIKEFHSNCIVVVSSFDDHTNSVFKALSLKADDFFSKKMWPKNIPQRLHQLYLQAQVKSGKTNIHSLLQKESTNSSQNEWICAGATLKSIQYRTKFILESEARCILIEGETGTGKEVVADLFDYDTKQKGPFIRLNCASLSPNLLESELFGHKKGAFTGALNDKVGFIESAHNGFLFLDEIASLSETAQSVLLRVIENQEIVRIGETYSRKINVRFLCATNISLKDRVEKKLFRKDLWQRLREIEIILPPLFKRKEEIAELIDFFCKNFKEGRYVVEPLAKQVLCGLDWRYGNVRELRNTLRAMTEFAQNGILGVNAIPARIVEDMNSKEQISRTPMNLDAPHLPHHEKPDDTKSQAFYKKFSVELFCTKQNRHFFYNELCDQVLKNSIDSHIKENGKLNTSQLAKELNISRTTLQSKIKEFSV